MLLGAWTLVTWGNAPIGWWSHMTHNLTGGGIKENLRHPDLSLALRGIDALPTQVRRKVDAALFWVREPQRMLREHHRPNILRTYVAYWTAFECLVYATCALRPQQKLAPSAKQAKIDDYLRRRGGKLTPGDVSDCYRSVVNQGFVGKASHALRVCFGDLAPGYVDECFTAVPKSKQLYAIRNAINHGEVDAENVTEQLRIQSSLSRLWMILFGMFGRHCQVGGIVADRPPRSSGGQRSRARHVVAKVRAFTSNLTVPTSAPKAHPHREPTFPRPTRPSPTTSRAGMEFS